MTTTLRKGWAALALVLALGPRPAWADYPVRVGDGTLRTLCSQSISGSDATCQSVRDVRLQASGVAAVTGTLSATGQSASFTPLAGRPANAAFTGTGTFSIQLERQLGGSWFPISQAGAPRYAWSTNGTATVAASDSFTETQTAVAYRWNVTACAGCSVSYRLEQ